MAVVQDLQEHVEDVRMGFFDLVQEHHGVGLLADLLGELSALLVPHVSRRRAHQAADGELLHVFAHVDAHERVLGLEQDVGQRLAKLRLPHSRGTQEHERPDGPAVVVEAGAAAADGLGHHLDGPFLPHHALVQGDFQTQEVQSLRGVDLGDGDARHLGDDPGDDVLVHFQALGALLFLPLDLGLGQGLLELLLLVAKARRGLVVLIGDGLLLLLDDLGDLVLHLADGGRHGEGRKPDPGSRFVDDVDGLVRQEPVVHVALGQGHRGLDGLRGVEDLVVLLVAFLEPHEDLHRLGGGRGIYGDGLEAALQGAVLLDVLAVLVEGGGSDALQFAARQGRLEDVGGVQAAFGPARSDDGVDLVDEGDDVVVLLQFGHERLQALLELAPVLCARHDARHVQRDHPLALQHLGDLALHDLERQALHDGRLAHPGFADEERIVLLAARQDLDDALDLRVAADDGIQLAGAGELGQIPSEVVQERRLALLLAGHLGAFGEARSGRGGLGGLRTAEHPVDLFPAGVVVHSHGGERRSRGGLVVLHERQQDVLGPDVLVAHGPRFLRGDLQDLLGPRSEGDHLSDGHHAAGRVDLLLDGTGEFLQVHALVAQHGDGDPVPLPDQAQEKMFGPHVVVAQPDGLLTCQLHDLLDTIGEHSIHGVLPLRCFS